MEEFTNAEEKGLVKQETGVLDRPVSLLEAMGRRREAVETAIKITRKSGGWINMGGKPYLTEAGARAITQLLPIRTEFIEKPKKHWESDDIGSYYIYICVVAASWTDDMKGYDESIGTCSSRDKFFAQREGETLPMSEVDEPNIIKKCGTNGKGNAIKGLLALKGMTWEELDRIAGIQAGEATKVEYRAKKQDENPEEADKTRAEIRRMIMEMCRDDSDEAAKYLESVTTFKGRDGKQVPGKKNIKFLSEKQAQVTYGKVKDQHTKWLAAQGQNSTPSTPEDGLQRDLEGM